MSFPELPLDPPEDVVIGHCYCCGYEIYEGELYWICDGGEMIREEHLELDEKLAKLFGCRKTDNRE